MVGITQPKKRVKCVKTWRKDVFEELKEVQGLKALRSSGEIPCLKALQDELLLACFWLMSVTQNQDSHDLMVKKFLI